MNVTPQAQSVSLPLLAVLLAGAALRLWGLGTQSLWFDEMLLARNAQYGLDYILSISRDLEVHPPFFYLFTKLLLLLGGGDALLRLPSALAGVATIVLVYRLGARHLESRPIGLVAAALLAVDPMHIWISRQARPYGLLCLFFTLTVFCLLDLVRTWRTRDAWRLCLANLPILLIHYAGLVILAAQALALAAASLARRRPPGRGVVLALAAGTILGFAPSAPFFWAAKFGRGDVNIRAGESIAAALDRVLGACGDLLAFGIDSPVLRAATLVCVLALALLGLRALFARGLSAAPVLAALLVAPPALLIAARFSSHLYAVHLSFALPVVALAAGAGIERLRPARLSPTVPALGLLVVLGAGFVLYKGHDYYHPRGVVAKWWHKGHFREVAATLQNNFKPGDLFAFADLHLYEAVDWYAARSGRPDILRGQHLAPEGQNVVVTFVTDVDQFGHYFRGMAQFQTLFPEAGALARVDNMRLYTAIMPREPLLVLDRPRLLLPLRAWPHAIYRQAWSLDDLTVSPYFGFALVPTRFGGEGQVTYRLSNAAGVFGPGRPLDLNVLTVCRIQAPGNTAVVEYAFDDEPWAEAWRQGRPAPGRAALIKLPRRDRPFSRLSLRARLACGTARATSLESPLGQVRLESLTLFPDAPGMTFASSSLVLRETGLGPLEIAPPDTLIRWGLGRASVLRFDLDRPEPLVLRLALRNRIPGQGLAVVLNGQPVATFADLAPDILLSRTLELEGRAGPNVLELRYAAHNGLDPASTFAPGDPRPLAAAYEVLALDVPGSRAAAPLVQDVPAPE